MGQALVAIRSREASVKASRRIVPRWSCEGTKTDATTVSVLKYSCTPSSWSMYIVQRWHYHNGQHFFLGPVLERWVSSNSVTLWVSLEHPRRLIIKPDIFYSSIYPVFPPQSQRHTTHSDMPTFNLSFDNLLESDDSEVAFPWILSTIRLTQNVARWNPRSIRSRPWGWRCCFPQWPDSTTGGKR